MRPERREHDRTFQSIHPGCVLVKRSLEQIERPVFIAEPGVNKAR
jgi:hypothetical protein